MGLSPARLAPRVIAAASLVGVATAVFAVIRPWGALVIVAVLAWFIRFGVALARRLLRSEDTHAHWLFGPAWGVGLSVLGLLALWQLGGRGIWILVLAPWPLWVLARLPLQRMGVDLRVPRLGRRDVMALCLLFLLVPAIAGGPFAHVAEVSAEGSKAYRAYFTADFVWAMTVIHLFTDVPDMQHVWVGWRAGHLLFVALTVFTAILLTAAQRSHITLRAGVWGMVAVLALAALPTVAMDVYNAQDITNGGPGPGFPWTLVLSRGEVEALDWLKTHTPRDVIVQPNVAERANASWGYMTAFGERRMSAGLPIAMIPMQPYKDASALVGSEVFGQADPVARAKAARRMHIDYLYVGPVEQERHPDLVASFETRSDLFPVAFRNREVVIFLVSP